MSILKPIPMHRRIMAETLFSVLIGCAAVAAWYDVNVSYEMLISSIVNRWVHAYPILAALLGVVTLALVMLLSQVWCVKFRYAFALFALGMVFGHLIWSQPKPADQQHYEATSSTP